jgi:ribosomal protein S18 acetylase RimI-like enzyme
MPMPASPAPEGPGAERRIVRSLTSDDLEAVVAIDLAHAGEGRRHFYAKRMAAAAKHPEDFVQLGVAWDGALDGFAIVRMLRGEFGRQQAAVLDAIGVAPQSQEHGVGRRLIQELVGTLRGMGIRVLHSQVDWKDQPLLRFLQASGFEIAPRLALERSVREPLREAEEEG